MQISVIAKTPFILKRVITKNVIKLPSRLYLKSKYMSRTKILKVFFILKFNKGLSWEVAFVLVFVVEGKQLKGDEQASGVKSRRFWSEE